MARLLMLVLLMLASGFGGYQYSETQSAKKVAALNAEIYDHGVILQTETNNTAEANRKLKISNRSRIDAIQINDHATKTVRVLQEKLDKASTELHASRMYRVINLDSVRRVYDQARNECHGLPDSNDPPIISAQLSEFTGDSVAGVVRNLVARYCEVATDYNGLYDNTERLLEGKKKPAQ